jgi:LacI family transcriptional regulator
MDARDGKRAAVTLREVARAAGVHPGTVSRALNADTRSLVNDATAERVEAVAKQLGYRPNSIARGLKTNQSHTVGVLIPDLTNPLFPPILRGIQDRLEDDGYTPLIVNTDNQAERERAGTEAMLARQVDGIISGTARCDPGQFDDVLAFGIGLVLVNRWIPGAQLSSVTPDDTTGQRLAVEHLLGLGHREIAYLAGPQDHSTGSDRLAAFETAMAAAGIDRDPGLTRVADAQTEAEGERLLGAMLEAGARPTAVAAANDLLAVGCLDALAERGIDCPGQLSLTGFNDMPFASRFAPPLTTVRIPHYELGTAAAELMLERLRDPDAEVRHLRLQPQLVVRGSTVSLAATAPLPTL